MLKMLFIIALLLPFSTVLAFSTDYALSNTDLQNDSISSTNIDVGASIDFSVWRTITCSSSNTDHWTKLYIKPVGGSYSLWETWNGCGTGYVSSTETFNTAGSYQWKFEAYRHMEYCYYGSCYDGGSESDTEYGYTTITVNQNTAPTITGYGFSSDDAGETIIAWATATDNSGVDRVWGWGTIFDGNSGSYTGLDLTWSSSNSRWEFTFLGVWMEYTRFCVKAMDDQGLWSSYTSYTSQTIDGDDYTPVADFDPEDGYEANSDYDLEATATDIGSHWLESLSYGSAYTGSDAKFYIYSGYGCSTLDRTVTADYVEHTGLEAGYNNKYGLKFKILDQQFDYSWGGVSFKSWTRDRYGQVDFSSCKNAEIWDTLPPYSSTYVDFDTNSDGTINHDENLILSIYANDYASGVSSVKIQYDASTFNGGFSFSTSQEIVATDPDQDNTWTSTLSASAIPWNEWMSFRAVITDAASNSITTPATSGAHVVDGSAPSLGVIWVENRIQYISGTPDDESDDKYRIEYVVSDVDSWTVGLTRTIDIQVYIPGSGWGTRHSVTTYFTGNLYLSDPMFEIWYFEFTGSDLYWAEDIKFWISVTSEGGTTEKAYTSNENTGDPVGPVMTIPTQPGSVSQSQPVTVEVIASDPSVVDWVKFYYCYRADSDASQCVWDTYILDGTNGVGPTSYYFTINPTHTLGTIYYRVQSIDFAGNTRWSHDTSNPLSITVLDDIAPNFDLTSYSIIEDEFVDVPLKIQIAVDDDLYGLGGVGLDFASFTFKHRLQGTSTWYSGNLSYSQVSSYRAILTAEILDVSMYDISADQNIEIEFSAKDVNSLLNTYLTVFTALDALAGNIGGLTIEGADATQVGSNSVMSNQIDIGDYQNSYLDVTVNVTDASGIIEVTLYIFVNDGSGNYDYYDSVSMEDLDADDIYRIGNDILLPSALLNGYIEIEVVDYATNVNSHGYWWFRVIDTTAPSINVVNEVGVTDSGIVGDIQITDASIGVDSNDVIVKLKNSVGDTLTLSHFMMSGDVNDMIIQISETESVMNTILDNLGLNWGDQYWLELYVPDLNGNVITPYIAYSGTLIDTEKPTITWITAESAFEAGEDISFHVTIQDSSSYSVDLSDIELIVEIWDSKDSSSWTGVTNSIIADSLQYLGNDQWKVTFFADGNLFDVNNPMGWYSPDARFSIKLSNIADQFGNLGGTGTYISNDMATSDNFHVFDTNIPLLTDLGLDLSEISNADTPKASWTIDWDELVDQDLEVILYQRNYNTRAQLWTGWTAVSLLAIFGSTDTTTDDFLVSYTFGSLPYLSTMEYYITIDDGEGATASQTWTYDVTIDAVPPEFISQSSAMGPDNSQDGLEHLEVYEATGIDYVIISYYDLEGYLRSETIDGSSANITITQTYDETLADYLIQYTVPRLPYLSVNVITANVYDINGNMLEYVYQLVYQDNMPHLISTDALTAVSNSDDIVFMAQTTTESFWGSEALDNWDIFISFDNGSSWDQCGQIQYCSWETIEGKTASEDVVGYTQEVYREIMVSGASLGDIIVFRHDYIERSPSAQSIGYQGSIYSSAYVVADRLAPLISLSNAYYGDNINDAVITITTFDHDSSIAKVTGSYTTDGITWFETEIMPVSNEYSLVIPAQPVGTTIEWKINSFDIFGNQAQIDGSYTITSNGGAQIDGYLQSHIALGESREITLGTTEVNPILETDITQESVNYANNSIWTASGDAIVIYDPAFNTYTITVEYNNTGSDRGIQYNNTINPELYDTMLAEPGSFISISYWVRSSDQAFDIPMDVQPYSFAADGTQINGTDNDQTSLRRYYLDDAEWGQWTKQELRMAFDPTIDEDFWLKPALIMDDNYSPGNTTTFYIKDIQFEFTSNYDQPASQYLPFRSTYDITNDQIILGAINTPHLVSDPIRGNVIGLSREDSVGFNATDDSYTNDISISLSFNILNDSGSDQILWTQRANHTNWIYHSRGVLYDYETSNIYIWSRDINNSWQSVSLGSVAFNSWHTVEFTQIGPHLIGRLDNQEESIYHMTSDLGGFYEPYFEFGDYTDTTGSFERFLLLDDIVVSGINQTESHTKWVEYQGSYENPVVFYNEILPDDQYRSGGGATQHITMWGKNETGFYLGVVQDSNSIYGLDNTKVEVLIMEAGNYYIAGLMVQVGEFYTSSYSTHIFDYSFSTAPVVLTAVQSNAGQVPIRTRTKSVTTTSFEVELEEGFLSSSSRNESIAFMAIESGGSYDNSIYTTTITTGDNFLSTSIMGHRSSPMAFVHLMSEGDTDGAYAVMRNVTSSRIEVAVEESLGLDGDHGNETLGIMMIEQGTLWGSVVANEDIIIHATISLSTAVSIILKYTINDVDQDDIIMDFDNSLYSAIIEDINSGDTYVFTIEVIDEYGVTTTYVITRIIL